MPHSNNQLLGVFQPETGRNISRFGAALGGSLGEFDRTQAVLQQAEQEQMDKRRTALLLDNRQVRRMLGQNDVAGATSLLRNRVENIQRLGGDAKDTSGLLRQIESGDAKGAFREVVLLDQRASDEGLLEPFPTDKVLSTEGGQVVLQTPAGEVIAEPISGFAKKPGTAKDIDGVLRFTDTGKAVIPGEGKRITAKLARDSRKAAATSAKGDFKNARDLRVEFTKASGDFVKIRDSFERIQRAGNEPTAAGDLALIFNYMKMLDPGSVVRESEFATAQNSAGVPERIRARFNNILRGERLGPDQRADFIDRARSLFAGQSAIQQENVNRYSTLASKFEIDPTLVVSDLAKGITQSAEIAAPAEAPAPVTDFPGFKVIGVE